MTKSPGLKPARSKRTQPEFDPSELADLILTPAVGTGVGSHLVETTIVVSQSPIVVSFNETTVDKIWITEAGEPIPQSRVKPIRVMEDILNTAEKIVYAALWGQGREQGLGPSRMVQAGYHPLMKQTGLSKKTIQRVIDRLTAKDFIAVERQADIYQRMPTIYRVFSFPEILERLERRGRSHTARIGLGVVYARPLETYPTKGLQ